MMPLRRRFMYLGGTVFLCALIGGAIFVYLGWIASPGIPTRPLIQITGTIPEDPAVAKQPVVVFALASDPDGIAQVELWINGQKVGAQANPDQTGLLPFETSQAWIPNGAGNYLIVLKATDRAGFLAESDPRIVQVQERSNAPDPQMNGEYFVQPADTLEKIAAVFGTTPEELRARNPELGDLTPGSTILVPPRPETDTPGEAAGPPVGEDAGVPVVDPPPAPPAPGAETEARTAPGEWWAGLPLPEGFTCVLNPAACRRAIDLPPPPFPAPNGVNFAAGEGCGIEVFWTDNSEGEDGFRIYRFTNRPRFRLDMLESVAASAGTGMRLRYLDTNPPGGEFFYGIVAYNAGGDTWSGPSPTVESEGCPPTEPPAEEALVVEGLALDVMGSFDRLYCYASLADSPFERVPAGASNFISLEAGSWNIADHFSGSNKREVLVPAAGPLNIVVECLGWQGEDLINLGRFSSSHPPADWNGRRLTGSPAGGGFTLTYRIAHSFHAADESGRADWPLVNPRAPTPYNLRLIEDTSDCRLPPDRREPGDPCERTILTWDYTPAAADPASPLAYKVYRRSTPGGTVPTHFYTTETMRAPVVTEDCNRAVFYQVSAVVDHDPVTGAEVQSPLSDELEVSPTCASLEITLETLWVYGVHDGDLCTVFDDCRNDYEAYGWLDFNGHRILWNDHCDAPCAHVGPSYSTLLEASNHNWSAFLLNTGDGWRRNNHVIRIPIREGEALSLVFSLLDHDSSSSDDVWCGRTGRPEITIPARPVSEWQSLDQSFQVDTAPRGEECLIDFHVRGVR